MRNDTTRRTLAAMAVTAALSGCATTGVQNASGVAPMRLDPARPGAVQGVGIESHDIVAMTDRMMRDMLSNPRLSAARGAKSPNVIIDANYFHNDSSQPINRNIITDRLRVNLNRAAAGRMRFVGRQNIGMVEHERALKRAGKVDVGTSGLTRATLGGDFRLAGRISSLDARSRSTGMIQRFTQITFEMVDLESGEIVWSGMYDFARGGADDVVYR